MSIKIIIRETLIPSIVDKKNSIVCYSVNDGWFTFGASNKLINKFFKNFKFDENIDANRLDFEQFKEAAYKERNVTYKGLDFPRGVSKTLKDFIVDNIGNKVQVMYKEGFESFTDDQMECGSDGLNHIFKIGKSTGKKPIPLAVYESDPYGGPSLMLNGIKGYRSL